MAENIGIISVVWAILRTIWEAIGHIGNLQTLWDIVKGWPIIFQYCALVLASWWFPLALPTDDFRTGMEFAAWLTEALKEAQIDASLILHGNPETLPEGVSIYWRKNNANKDMAERIIKAVAIKGIVCREVSHPVKQSEINLMVKLDTRPPS